MDWTNERYVRLWVRDGMPWKRATWEARCTYAMLIRKVDRSGVLGELGAATPEALAVMIEMPLAVVMVGEPQLVDLGIIVRRDTHGGSYFVPDFGPAEEAVQSDKLRAANSRARRREVALGSTDVTKRDSAPRDNEQLPKKRVTKRDEKSLQSGPVLSGRSGPAQTAGEKTLSARGCATALPDGWEPPEGGETEQVIEQRSEEMGNSWDVPAVVRKFVRHHTDKGTRSTDWDALCATWIRDEDPRLTARDKGPAVPPGARPPRGRWIALVGDDNIECHAYEGRLYLGYAALPDEKHLNDTGPQRGFPNEWCVYELPARSAA